MTVIWRCGVIGNTRDSDSLVLGSRPNGAANMASSYNGSTWDFDSHSVGSIPAHPAKNVEDIRTSDARTAPARTRGNPVRPRATAREVSERSTQ